ncbi:MAG: hypothetical protein ACT4O1_15295 [Gemmatimonadota bacterium]
MGVFALAALTCKAGFAQGGDAWSFGFGAGPSFTTNTPQRPAPPEGEGLTGAAGPAPGINVRLLAERRMKWQWLHTRYEVFVNRLVTNSRTFNCMREDDSTNPPQGICHPAAKVDRAVGVVVGGRAHLGTGALRPSLSGGIGAAHFTLVPDPSFAGLENRSSTKPVIKVGMGIELKRHRVSILSEAALQMSLGRGGGSNHYPISLAVMF